MEWIAAEYGSNSYCIIAGLFRVSINWQPDGYHVFFMGARLINPIRDLDEAKTAGLALAKRRLTAALAELEVRNESVTETD